MTVIKEPEVNDTPIYDTPQLQKLTLSWVNHKKVKVKNYTSKDDFFKKELKSFEESLSKVPGNFEFNRKSIYLILDQIFKIK